MARSVVSCLVAVLCLAGCSTEAPVNVSRPQPRSHTAQALGGSYSGTAQFDAPVVDPNTWQGSPIGTGTWSASSSPAQSGGPSAIGFHEMQAGSTAHYLMIGNFAGSGHFFGIVSEGKALSTGTTTISGSGSLYVGIFDATTGDAVAIASSGTLTLSAAGLIGGRITGSFSGTMDELTGIGCTSNAQCSAGQSCINGSCVLTGCTSSSQCSTGQVCSGGRCVSSGCTSNAQCGSGQVCSGGQCVTTGCTSNSQCGSGQVCSGGQCVTAGCTSNAQCGSGQVCQAGQCVTAPPPPSCDGMQGTGEYYGRGGNAAVCGVFPSSTSVGAAFAAIGRDDQGQLNLYVMDPALDAAGLVFPLTACPSAPGPVSSTGAAFWDQTSSGGATFYSMRPATSASLNFQYVGGSVRGDFSVTLTGGGQLRGSFDVR